MYNDGVLWILLCTELLQVRKKPFFDVENKMFTVTSSLIVLKIAINNERQHMLIENLKVNFEKVFDNQKGLFDCDKSQSYSEANMQRN